MRASFLFWRRQRNKSKRFKTSLSVFPIPNRQRFNRWDRKSFSFRRKKPFKSSWVFIIPFGSRALEKLSASCLSLKSRLQKQKRSSNFPSAEQCVQPRSSRHGAFHAAWSH